ncbi:MAG: response regulator [Terrimicrobiaceae bacterium]
MNPATTQSQIVYLIDDDESLRTALARVLRAGGYAVCTYGTVADFLLARETPLRGCLVLDVRMPGGPSGLELQRALIRQGEKVPVIFLTGHGDIPMGVQAMKDGAFDFLTKPVERKMLLQSVRAAFNFEEARYLASARRRDLEERATLLTRTEREVFRLVVEGDPNKQIAAALQCSERTVKSHRAQIMAKMGATSLAELVQMSGTLGPKDG